MSPHHALSRRFFAAMMPYAVALALALALLPASIPAARADIVQLDGVFVQGGYALGRVAPGTGLRYAGRDVRIAADGRFIIGFHRDEGPEVTLTLRHADGREDTRRIAIRQRNYAIQRIDGLAPDRVTPPDDTLARIRAEAALVKRARATDSPDTSFAGPFIWPVTGRISGVFGAQRILNGVPRQPHFGIDIAAPKGTAVLAPADGRVILAHPDMYFSGATLMLDHGHGLASTFLHLDGIDVAPDQFVRRGQHIATVGSSGRSTGPHLDWRVNWFDKRLDAALLVPPMPETDGDGS